MSTCRPCTATTDWCCAFRTSISSRVHRRTWPTSCWSTRTRWRTWSPSRSAGPRSSPRVSASARLGRCCCRADGREVAQPLWQQRQRAAQLLEVASRYPTFPIVLETVRECLQDVFDVPGLVELMRDSGRTSRPAGRGRDREPSPFARSLLFGYVAAVPLRGRLTAGGATCCRARAGPDAARRAPRSRRGRGPARPARPRGDHAAPSASCSAWTPNGRHATPRTSRTCCAHWDRRAWPRSRREAGSRLRRTTGWSSCSRPAGSSPVRIAGEERWAAVEDAGRLLDALGTALPVGVPEVFREPVPDPLGDLLARFARTHGPFTTAEAAHRFGLGAAVAAAALARLVADGRLVEGELPARRPGPRALRPPGAAHASDGGPSPPCGTRWSRCPPRTSRASCRPGRGSADGSTARTGWSAWWSSWRARSCPRARWRRWCCPAGSWGGAPRCWTR